MHQNQASLVAFKFPLVAKLLAVSGAFAALAELPALNPAYAETTIDSSSSMVKELSTPADGAIFLKTLISNAKQFDDYWYESTLTTFREKGKKVVETGRFYFKAPRLVRFEALKAGRKSGSVVVWQPDGKIRAKAGGLLGAIPLTLSPDSKLLRTSNGVNVLKSDLLSMLEGLKGSITSGTSCIVSKVPCEYPGISKAFVLELVGKDNQVKQRVALDSQKKLPREWAVFENGKLASLADFTKIALQSEATEAMFYLEGEKLAGKSLGMTAMATSDRIRQAVDTAGEGLITPELMSEAATAIDELVSASDDIARAHLSERDSDDTSVWAKNGRAELLARAASIEATADSLKELTPALKAYRRAGKGHEEISGDWSRGLESIDRSTEIFYDSLESNKVDADSIIAEATSISNQASMLLGLVTTIKKESTKRR